MSRTPIWHRRSVCIRLVKEFFSKYPYILGEKDNYQITTIDQIRGAIFPHTHILANKLKVYGMPRSVRTPADRNDPASLPKSTRDYYRSTWGFDPVVDCRHLGKDSFRYEECFPLSQDLPLQAVGITIGARVDWGGEEIHNRIVFHRTDMRGRRRTASVECTHTVVYAGPASDALTFADDIYTSADAIKTSDWERLTPNEKLVTLPPWEHFAALKSYVAAVADMGVIALLLQSIVPSTAPTVGLPFGFNAEMQAQVVDALYAIAPRALVSIYRDLTCEFLDTHPQAALIDQWMEWPMIFIGRSKRKHWGLLLRRLGEPTLMYWFRHTEIADKLQDRLFTKPALLARAQAIAPDLPWDTLRNEWRARTQAECSDHVICNGIHEYLLEFPQAEVWPRHPFSCYEFPREILSRASASIRRSRVETHLREVIEYYGRDGGMEEEFEQWGKDALDQVEAAITKPFPVERVRLHETEYYLRWNDILMLRVLAHHVHNALVVASLSPEFQADVVADCDFVSRLALVGNPRTNATVLATLVADPQPCVRAAAAARLRLGTTTIEPLIGEVLDPGEMMWLFAAYPGIFFHFGVLTGGDESLSYTEWFKRQLQEDPRWEKSIGKSYAWGYIGGLFCQHEPLDERGYLLSHLAYYGWGEYACGHLPCIYLGPEGWTKNLQRAWIGVVQKIW